MPADKRYPFQEMGLPYAYDALEPHISAEVLQTHYEEIYLPQLRDLNALVTGVPDIQSWTLQEILLYQIDNAPVTLRRTAKFLAGGVYCHELFFASLAPAGTTAPSGALLRATEERYGSPEQMRSLIMDAANTLLGVGWIWLNSEKNGGLHMAALSDYQVPLLSAVEPVLNFDTWEHAYLRQYGTDREAYLNNWFEVVNWDEAGRRFEQSLTAVPAAWQRPDARV